LQGRTNAPEPIPRLSKRLDLLLKLVPEVTTIGYMFGDRAESEVDNLLASAHLRRRIMVLECHRPADLDNAFATMAEQRAGGVLVGAFPAAFSNRMRVFALAADHRIPAIYAQSPYVREGGLMSYSPVGTLRHLAVQYVARILKGEKAADLPSSNRPFSGSSSIQRLPERLALTCPRRCLPAPTR